MLSGVWGALSGVFSKLESTVIVPSRAAAVVDFELAEVEAGGLDPTSQSRLEDWTVSTERLREPAVVEVRRRFRELSSPSNGFGLVPLGSDETARSLVSISGDLESRSIGGC